MMWTSIVGYFSDSSRIAAIYGITLMIRKELIHNEKVICLLSDNNELKGDINKLCEQRLLFNFISINCDFRKSDVNNHFTSESNYFIIPHLYGFHLVVILGTTAISPHLLPLSFHLMNKKAGTYFKEWHLMHYDVDVKCY